MSAGEDRVLAAIDIGTNSVLLTVARSTGDGGFKVLEQRATVTRLGQDVDRTSVLHPDAQERTLVCLSEYRTAMDHWGVRGARAVGTSAMRDAAGGDVFVEKATAVLGFRPEIVSGAREAELTFIGALSGLSVAEMPGSPVFVFDIGGGSTELIVGRVGARPSDRPTIEQSTSLNLGSVRLTERNGLSDPPDHNQLTQVREQVQAALIASGIVVRGPLTVVGVAGTVTTLAAISEKMQGYDAARIHGHLLKKTEIERISAQLSALPLEKRQQIPGLSKGRADVIVCGSILCNEIAAFAGAEQLVVSDRGVRFGLLSEMM